MKRLGISTDCICDLPDEYLRANGVDIMHFYIHTPTGRFKDGVEITSANILEYLESGEKLLKSNIPAAEEYKVFFEKILQRYDHVIHITTSDKAGESFPHAQESLPMLGEDGKRVTLINSKQLSTGLGHLVLKAVEMRDQGKSVEEIVAVCEEMRERISSSFIVPDADYLYHMGRVSKGVRNLSKFFRLHPVLFMKDGKITVKSFQMGNYEKSVLRYVRSEFKQAERIDRRQLFITHAGSPAKIIRQIMAEAEILCPFEKVTVTIASSAISSNCGPQTVGVLFVCK